MAQITTYATLQAAVLELLHTSNAELTAYLPTAIQLCEADLYDKVLAREMETEETLTLTQDENYVALPSGFISPIALWLVVDSERNPLTQALVTELEFSTTNSIPRFWAIDGANIRFDCPAAAAYTAPLRFVKSNALSDSNTSNYILLRRPDIYLYGTLKQADLWAENAEGAAKWHTLYTAAKHDFTNAEARSKKTPLRTDFPGTGRKASIFSGE